MIYFNQLELLPLDVFKDIKLLAVKATKILKCNKKAISITFCRDPFIRELNKKYRHKDKPTDVLSFPLGEKSVLGDIIISLDTAKQNCRRFGTSVKEELMFLIVHGLCHLLGHDHHKKAEELKMQKLEKMVLLKLLGRNYHA